MDRGLEAEFELQRVRLRAIAFRILGSVADADDAVQEAWLRASRADFREVENPAAWLTTITTRVCINVLRHQDSRPEAPAPLVPDLLVSDDGDTDPESNVLLGDAVGTALQVVVGTLSPAERVAFVLHDLFAVPFPVIGDLLDRSPEATRQLASRARRRVRDGAPTPDKSLADQRAVVDAFFAASRAGDLEGLLAVLHPDVVLRSDGGSKRPQITMLLRGASAVAAQAAATAALAPFVRPVLVNGTPGVVVVPRKRIEFVMAFDINDGRIRSIDILGDPDRLDELVGHTSRRPRVKGV